MNPLEENDSHSHLFRLPALNPLRSSLDWTLFMSLFEFPGLMVMFSPIRERLKIGSVIDLAAVKFDSDVPTSVGTKAVVKLDDPRLGNKR